jgi:hypothetical protein
MGAGVKNLRSICLLGTGLVAALSLAGVALTGTLAAPGRTFTKADVHRILLKPSDSPAGLKLNSDETGIFDCNSGDPAIDPVHTGDPGCIGSEQIAYQGAGGGRPYAHVSIFLFGTSKQATRILPTATENVKGETGHTFTGGPSKGLGWQGLHLTGKPDDGKASSDYYVFYVWRYRNAVLEVNLQGAPLAKMESIAYSLAKKLDAKAKAG